MMNLLKGKIKYAAGKVFEGQFGASINAVVCLDNGEECRVYGKPDDEKLKALKKDDAVTIIYDGKSYKIAFDTTTADTLESKPKANGKLTEEELIEKATFMTSVYTSIYKQMLTEGLEPLQAQPAAATVFIQIGKFL